MAVYDKIADFFSISSFMPHGHCYLWKPALLFLQVGSDSTIALSYLLIPIALTYFVRQRKDVPFSWIFFLFCSFILACGMTHVMEIVTVWRPYYWMSGLIKATTGIISLTTAILLIKYIPDLLALPDVGTFIKANKVLEKSTAKFKSFLEGAPDAMIITNQDGQINLINAKTEKIFGFTRNEILGQNVEFLLPERLRFSHLGQRIFHPNPLARPMGADASLFGQRKDGTEFPIEISLSPVETEEGLLMMAAIRDVTEKKNIEKLLIEKNVQLVNSDMAKDQFLTHMSHELRTPLNGIIAMTQLLMSDGLLDAKKEQLDIISESNQQLMAVINQILDFSKVETGSIGIDQVGFEVRSVLEKMIAPFKVKAQEKKIPFICHVDSAVPRHLIGDLVKLRQILGNILDNALKFTEEGSVQLNVIAGDTEDVLTFIVFEVVDTGIGIEPDILPKLFKPFSQGDSSLSRKYGGTGLGLAISKRLTEVLGGTVEVSSCGKGSRFLITIPFMLDHVIEDNKFVVTPEKLNITSNNNEKARVLLVEDNKLNQRTLTLVLKKLGYHAVIANDGAEALSVLKDLKFDLILMDCQMPNIDGYKTTLEIRKKEENTGEHVPIIGVTAHAITGNREKCLSVGMDNYIAKPYSIYELNKMIKQYVLEKESVSE